jgi:hypothetical protein
MQPIQLKWFKIEVEHDGTIRTCTEVDAKARSGATVRYIEGLNAADACSKVKAWAAQFRTTKNARDRRWRSGRKDSKVCTRCASPELHTRTMCATCAAYQAEGRRRQRAGLTKPRPVVSPLELRGRILDAHVRKNLKRAETWGTQRGHEASLELKHLDEHGAAAYRERLCARIRKAGGGAALDAYEAERATARDTQDHFRTAMDRFRQGVEFEDAVNEYVPEAAE